MTWRMIQVDDNIPTITITVEEYMHLRECEAECNYNTSVDKSEVLDKIRAEIAELSHYYPMGHDYQIAITRCIAIIDKYRTESESQESEE